MDKTISIGTKLINELERDKMKGNPHHIGVSTRRLYAYVSELELKYSRMRTHQEELKAKIVPVLDNYRTQVSELHKLRSKLAGAECAVEDMRTNYNIASQERADTQVALEKAYQELDALRKPKETYEVVLDESVPL